MTMKWIEKGKRISLPILALVTLGLGGCIEYTVETTLNADGSGLRREKMIVADADNPGFEISIGEFQQVTGVITGEDGWTHEIEVDGEDTTEVFNRETRVQNLAGWEDVTRSLRFAGATTVNMKTRVGYVKLGDVQFWNTVKVETGRVGDATSYTYRETFQWENAVDALVEYMLGLVEERVIAEYPDLSEEALAEIIGTARGQAWAAIDQGLFELGGEEEERLLKSVVDRTAIQATRVVRRKYPDADEEFFRDMLTEVYDDEADKLGDFIDDKLLGLNVAASTEIHFRLRMPGRIITSNADERDGTTLIWKLGPMDALVDPVEIFAESVVGG
jgi:hypothetical protein